MVKNSMNIGPFAVPALDKVITVAAHSSTGNKW